MSGDGIPDRLAALTTHWEWIAGASERVDKLEETLESLKARLEKIDPEDINKSVLTLVETNEKVLPELEDKEEEYDDKFEDGESAFEKTSSELNRRIDAIKAAVG